MQHAKAGLEKVLMSINISAPKGIFIPNVTATPVSDPETIRQLLAKQLTSPVQWIKTMETIADYQPIDLLETGSGKVLKGLARKINPELNVTSVESKEDFEQLKTISTVNNAS